MLFSIGTVRGNVEEDQQFLYYFYEAQRLIQKQEIAPAWELVQFCHDLKPNDAAVNYYMGVFMEAFDRPGRHDRFYIAPGNTVIFFQNMAIFVFVEQGERRLKYR